MRIAIKLPSVRTRSAFLALTLVCAVVYPGTAQKSPKVEQGEMLSTSEGFLAIATPKGWVRSEGPGLAFFVRENDDPGAPGAYIYISGADGKLKEFLEADIAAFRARFKNASIHEEAPIKPANSKTAIPVWSFQSGEERNGFERMALIQELDRVLILTLSAPSRKLLDQSLPAFEGSVKSYRGSVIVGSPRR